MNYDKYEKNKIMNKCNHWGCDLKSNKCIGCGNTICSVCLKDPPDCTCKFKDNNCCNIKD